MQPLRITAAVQDLCRGVTHIGKKSSQGLGAVDYWLVEPWPEDWSVVAGGRLARAVPMEEGMPPGVEKANVAMRGMRPPYWHPDNQRVCLVPEVGHGQGTVPAAR